MFDDDDLDAVFDLLKRIADATVVTVGPHTEAVVHDFRHPESSIVGIAGNLTNRSVGAPISDAQFLPANLHKIKDDIMLCRTKTRDGKNLISSEVFVRNRRNEVVGAFGINIDREGIRKFRDLLNEMLQEKEEPAADEAVESFAANTDDYVNIALKAAEKELGKSIRDMRSPEKVSVIGILDRHGVFSFRQSVDRVAEALLLSRASVYSHLKRSRADKEAGDAEQ